MFSELLPPVPPAYLSALSAPLPTLEQSVESFCVNQCGSLSSLSNPNSTGAVDSQSSLRRDNSGGLVHHSDRSSLSGMVGEESKQQSLRSRRQRSGNSLSQRLSVPLNQLILDDNRLTISSSSSSSQSTSSCGSSGTLRFEGGRYLPIFPDRFDPRARLLQNECHKLFGQSELDTGSSSPSRRRPSSVRQTTQGKHNHSPVPPTEHDQGLRSDRSVEAVQMIQILLPLLFELFTETTKLQTRLRCLEAIQRMLFFSCPVLLVKTLHPRVVCNHIVGMLNSPERRVLLSGLHIAIMLIDRIPPMFATYFRKEGILHQVDLLKTNLSIDCQTESRLRFEQQSVAIVHTEASAIVDNCPGQSSNLDNLLVPHLAFVNARTNQFTYSTPYIRKPWRDAEEHPTPGTDPNADNSLSIQGRRANNAVSAPVLLSCTGHLDNSSTSDEAMSLWIEAACHQLGFRVNMLMQQLHASDSPFYTNSPFHQSGVCPNVNHMNTSINCDLYLPSTDQSCAASDAPRAVHVSPGHIRPKFSENKPASSNEPCTGQRIRQVEPIPSLAALKASSRPTHSSINFPIAATPGMVWIELVRLTDEDGQADVSNCSTSRNVSGIFKSGRKSSSSSTSSNHSSTASTASIELSPFDVPNRSTLQITALATFHIIERLLLQRNYINSLFHDGFWAPDHDYGLSSLAEAYSVHSPREDEIHSLLDPRGFEDGDDDDDVEVDDEDGHHSFDEVRKTNESRRHREFTTHNPAMLKRSHVVTRVSTRSHAVSNHSHPHNPESTDHVCHGVNVGSTMTNEVSASLVHTTASTTEAIVDSGRSARSPDSSLYAVVSADGFQGSLQRELRNLLQRGPDPVSNTGHRTGEKADCGASPQNAQSRAESWRLRRRSITKSSISEQPWGHSPSPDPRSTLQVTNDRLLFHTSQSSALPGPRSPVSIIHTNNEGNPFLAEPAHHKPIVTVHPSTTNSRHRRLKGSSILAAFGALANLSSSGSQQTSNLHKHHSSKHNKSVASSSTITTTTITNQTTRRPVRGANPHCLFVSSSTSNTSSSSMSPVSMDGGGGSSSDHRGKHRPTLVFYIGDHQLPPTLPLFEAIRKFSPEFKRSMAAIRASQRRSSSCALTEEDRLGGTASLTGREVEELLLRDFKITNLWKYRWFECSTSTLRNKSGSSSTSDEAMSLWIEAACHQLGFRVNMLMQQLHASDSPFYTNSPFHQSGVCPNVNHMNTSINCDLYLPSTDQSCAVTPIDLMPTLSAIASHLSSNKPALWTFAFKQLVELLEPTRHSKSSTHPEPPSPFELHESGVTAALLSYLTASDACEVRLWIIYRMFFGTRSSSDVQLPPTCNLLNLNKKQSNTKNWPHLFPLTPVLLRTDKAEQLREVDYFIDRHVIDTVGFSSGGPSAFHVLLDCLLACFHRHEHFQVSSLPPTLPADSNLLSLLHTDSLSSDMAVEHIAFSSNLATNKFVDCPMTNLSVSQKPSMTSGFGRPSSRARVSRTHSSKISENKPASSNEPCTGQRIRQVEPIPSLAALKASSRPTHSSINFPIAATPGMVWIELVRLTDEDGQADVSNCSTSRNVSGIFKSGRKSSSSSTSSNHSSTASTASIELSPFDVPNRSTLQITALATFHIIERLLLQRNYINSLFHDGFWAPDHDYGLSSLAEAYSVHSPREDEIHSLLDPRGFEDGDDDDDVEVDDEDGHHSFDEVRKTNESRRHREFTTHNPAMLKRSHVVTRVSTRSHAVSNHSHPHNPESTDHVCHGVNVGSTMTNEVSASLVHTTASTTEAIVDSGRSARSPDSSLYAVVSADGFQGSLQRELRNLLQRGPDPVSNTGHRTGEKADCGASPQNAQSRAESWRLRRRSITKSSISEQPWGHSPSPDPRSTLQVTNDRLLFHTSQSSALPGPRSPVSIIHTNNEGNPFLAEPAHHKPIVTVHPSTTNSRHRRLKGSSILAAFGALANLSSSGSQQTSNLHKHHSSKHNKSVASSSTITTTTITNQTTRRPVRGANPHCLFVSSSTSNTSSSSMSPVSMDGGGGSSSDHRGKHRPTLVFYIGDHQLPPTLPLFEAIRKFSPEFKRSMAAIRASQRRSSSCALTEEDRLGGTASLTGREVEELTGHLMWSMTHLIHYRVVNVHAGNDPSTVVSTNPRKSDSQLFKGSTVTSPVNKSTEIASGLSTTSPSTASICSVSTFSSAMTCLKRRRSDEVEPVQAEHVNKPESCHPSGGHSMPTNTHHHPLFSCLTHELPLGFLADQSSSLGVKKF
ncbi:hypothetical protein AHF37_03275 [Paragonimus kellicotti]|nr:hypothetical protein AHF37_03275 [Paragonimus kellicotti]